MKAAVLLEPGKKAIKEVLRPKPWPLEVIIENRLADYAIYEKDRRVLQFVDEFTKLIARGVNG